MKLGKKLLALALAGALALSVLTACSGSGIIKSGNKLAKLFTVSLSSFGITVKYDSSLNKTAENAMRAVRTAVAKDNTITMDNAIKGSGGTLLNNTGFTPDGARLKTALDIEVGGANASKTVTVALVDTSDVKEEQYEIAKMFWEQQVTANSAQGGTWEHRMGYYESGHYILIVLVD